MIRVQPLNLKSSKLLPVLIFPDKSKFPMLSYQRLYHARSGQVVTASLLEVWGLIIPSSELAIAD
jgi:hypothetical protein